MIDPSLVTNNKLFWKKIKSFFFSNKENYGATMKLVGKEEILRNDLDTAEQFNEFLKKCRINSITEALL